MSLYLSDQQLLQLIEANAVSFLVNSVNQASVYWFLKLFEHGVSCGRLVDQIIEKTNEDQVSVNDFATYLPHQFWSFIKAKAVQNKDKETMFNKFYNLSIDEDMLSEWVKMLKCLGIVVQSSVVLEMTVQFILEIFHEFSLKLRNELLLRAIKDEINKAIHMKKSAEASLHYVAGYIIFSLKKV